MGLDLMDPVVPLVLSDVLTPRLDANGRLVHVLRVALPEGIVGDRVLLLHVEHRLEVVPVELLGLLLGYSLSLDLAANEPLVVVLVLLPTEVVELIELGSVEAGPGTYSQIIEGQEYIRIVYNSRLEIMFKI